MKAIKHIKAGLLHIEVIGQAPERPPGRRTRAGRSQKTCAAQQFYNDKCSSSGRWFWRLPTMERTFQRTSVRRINISPNLSGNTGTRGKSGGCC